MVLESVLVTYKPMAVSFQCMTKFTTNKKKKEKKEKKISLLIHLKIIINPSCSNISITVVIKNNYVFQAKKSISRIVVMF